MSGTLRDTWYNVSGEHMRKLAIRLITWYQRKISPHSRHRCRHAPTCSAYAKTCYERFNVFKASFLTAKRILTCNPLFKPKYDPVPEKKVKHSKKAKPD
ncbi:MAG: membrane protein insertion efficiency factor YidD [Acholeplasmataceae bacterium]|nr:MAG: membrane protein insertion efficiency factor YidD [Acholeplasmataceae bacterium]